MVDLDRKANVTTKMIKEGEGRIGCGIGRVQSDSLTVVVFRLIIFTKKGISAVLVQKKVQLASPHDSVSMSEVAVRYSPYTLHTLHIKRCSQGFSEVTRGSSIAVIVKSACH